MLLDATREETSKAQAADIEKHLDTHSVNAFNSNAPSKSSNMGKSNKICFNCGGGFPHLDKPCQAKNKTCACNMWKAKSFR